MEELRSLNGEELSQGNGRARSGMEEARSGREGS